MKFEIYTLADFPDFHMQKKNGTVPQQLDEILQLFTYQHSRYVFLYAISTLHKQFHAHHKFSNQYQQDLQQRLPDCLSPILSSRLNHKSGIDGMTTTMTTTPSTISNHLQPITQSEPQSQALDLMLLDCRTRFSFWNDVSNLLTRFDWRFDDEIDLKAKVAHQIRQDLNRSVKKNNKKWSKQSVK